MRGGIDENLYCSTLGMDNCPEKGNCTGCPDCHRKYPTPEQFKEEYGVEYPDDGAVYYRSKNDYTNTERKADGSVVPILEYTKWWPAPYTRAKAYREKYSENIPFEIVSACTPWGKPPDDWRQE